MRELSKNDLQSIGDSLRVGKKLTCCIAFRGWLGIENPPSHPQQGRERG